MHYYKVTVSIGFVDCEHVTTYSSKRPLTEEEKERIYREEVCNYLDGGVEEIDEPDEGVDCELKLDP